MKDPFPIPPIPALSRAVEPWAEYLGVQTLPLHVHEIILMAVFYHFVGSVVSPVVSRRLFPAQYSALPRGKRLSWDVHVVSLVQSTTINALALWVMFADDERRNMDLQERIWGYTGAAAMIQALAAGYFVWDLIITASHVHIFGLGMLAHAISALLVYSFGFRPFVNYYSCNFILWELSSPFLNIHWFFDKLGMTGSRAQLYNGILLIFTFFCCRLVWGTYQSFLIARDLWTTLHSTPIVPATLAPEAALNTTFPDQYTDTMRFVSESSSIPLWLPIIYTVSNLTLNSLNFYWFSKMIDAIRKRFQPLKEEDASGAGATSEGKATATAVDADTTGLKTRPRRRTILDGEEEGDEPPPV
ncbi:TLC domain-containing protein [Durotheca rogersii]|uniref:TLC domain-containing protein n=1 Tax=Durotheca rogersii TaxID=419775 RepID=UPI002220F037|nr:TLC domain-containing protein [Durotheca rogersii]KAI5864986.1 TLC domain-containing protein [Durotheca rogersii]